MTYNSVLAPVQVTEMVMVQPQAAVVTAEAVIVSTSLSYLASITSIMNVSDRASYIVCTIQNVGPGQRWGSQFPLPTDP